MTIPPLSALAVLDVLEQKGSVRATAQAVHLSQSAVSHKLRGLEERLGFALTEPKGRGLVLTAAARRYLAQVRPALAILREAHQGFEQPKGRLQIAVASGFAATWLAPRLPAFAAAFPEVELHLQSLTVAAELPVADLSIVFTDAPPEGAEKLFDVSFFPVCSPEFLHRYGDQTGLSPSQIRGDMLLHLNDPGDWANWLGRPVAQPGTLFSGLLAMYGAAEAGMGLCLGDAVTCDQALKSGRLLRPFAHQIAHPAGYWMCPAPGGLSGPGRALRDWLAQQSAA